MKPILTALAFSLSVAPAYSMNIDNITPVLTFPEPEPQPATKDADGINK